MRLDGNDFGWLLTLTLCWLCLADSAPRPPTEAENGQAESSVPDELPLETASETDADHALALQQASGTQTQSEPSQKTPDGETVPASQSEPELQHPGVERLLKQSIPGWGQDTPADVWKTPPGVVCRCQGRRTDQCLCLKAGVKCGCSAQEGSVWRKTGEVQPVQPEAARTASSRSQGYPVTSQGAWAYWTAHGVQWNNQGTGLKENQVYGLPGSYQFVYRQGRMYDYGSEAVAGHSSASARNPSGNQRWGWVRRCAGNRCYWSWEPLP